MTSLQIITLAGMTGLIGLAILCLRLVLLRGASAWLLLKRRPEVAPTERDSFRPVTRPPVRRPAKPAVYNPVNTPTGVRGFSGVRVSEPTIDWVTGQPVQQ